MIMNFFYVLFAIFFGATVLYIIKINENPARLTLRGKRVVFVISLIIGFALALFVTHFNVDCDLRTGATTACHVGWF
jgi:hypothetical protein